MLFAVYSGNSIWYPSLSIKQNNNTVAEESKTTTVVASVSCAILVIVLVFGRGVTIGGPGRPMAYQKFCLGPQTYEKIQRIKL